MEQADQEGRANTDTPLARRKQEKRDKILAAAAGVFAENGFSRTTMAQVAERADVGKGTLYEYFPSKEELYFNVFESFVRQVYGAVSGLTLSQTSDSAVQLLTRLNQAIVDQLQDTRKHYGLFMEFWSASANSGLKHRFQEAFRTMYRMYGDLVAGVVDKGVARGEFRSGVDTRALGSCLVGAWDAMGLQAWFDEDFSMVRTARTFMDVVLAGLKPDPGPGA